MNVKIATRIIFFIAGLVTATWAVIVPYAKFNTGVNDALLGSLLLCLGFGAMAGMPLTGILTSRFGCQRVITVAVITIIVTLPWLSFITSPLWLGVNLFIFGLGVGVTDCAMNVQAILVEKQSPKPLMSGFHGLFSLGGIAGAGTMTGLLSLELNVITSTAIMAVAVLILLLISYKRLLPYANQLEGPLFAIPKGVVLILGSICFIFFMAEGTVLDWSAVYLVESRGVPEAFVGLGFAAFATAMTIGRLSGDYIVGRYGAFTVVLTGTALTLIGFLIVIYAMAFMLVLLGYFFIGLGCANIVPIMFSLVGRQNSMPQMVAVPAITTLGYIGVLAGPAIIGYIAYQSSIAQGFIFVTLLIIIAAILLYCIRAIIKDMA